MANLPAVSLFLWIHFVCDFENITFKYWPHSPASICLLQVKCICTQIKGTSQIKLIRKQSLCHCCFSNVNVLQWRCTNNSVGPQRLIHADRTCSVHPGIKEPHKSRNQARPEWVAALIQQQTDHLSPLRSPYKSSTFPLFSSAAHKFIKLAFPCCFWQKGDERGIQEVYHGWSKAARSDPRIHRARCRAWGLPPNCCSHQNDTCAAFSSQLNKCWGITRLAGLRVHEHSPCSEVAVVPHKLQLSRRDV